MQLEHAFTVPVGVEEAFRVLRDIQTVGPCMPGATVDSVDGDTFTGKVKVKVGPIQVTYQGEAEFAVVDEVNHTATIVAKGKESRGSGTASATVTAELAEAGADTTEVKVVTDLNITGKPAQFGRGVMADVGEKLLNRFAECLESKLALGEIDPDAEGADTAITEDEESAEDSATTDDSAPAQPAAADATTEPTAAASTPSQTPPDEEGEALDLLEFAGPDIAKRLAPVAIGVAVLALIIWLIKRR